MRVVAHGGSPRAAVAAASAMLVLGAAGYAASVAPAAYTRRGTDAAHRRSHASRHHGQRGHTETVRDIAHLHLVGGRNTAVLSEQGSATGTIPGTVHLRLALNAYTVSASFTLHTRYGEISGHGKGKLKFGKGGYDSFAGAATITRGSGRYAHASAHGHIYGSIDRRNYRTNVQVTGLLHYR